MVRLGDAEAPPAHSRAEVLADAAMHMTGIFLALTAVPVMITLAAVWHGDVPTIAAAAVYGVSLIAMIGFSASYHLIPYERCKDILRRCDHAAIFVKIAGTYTPFAVLLAGEDAAPILIGIWGTALLGLTIKVAAPRRFEWASVALYLGMGWAALVIGGPIIDSMSEPGFILMCTGGILYTVGVIFYLWETLPFQNAIWHGMVLAASFVFYAAVMVEVWQSAHA